MMRDERLRKIRRAQSVQDEGGESSNGSKKLSRFNSRSKSTKRTNGCSLSALSFSQKQSLIITWRAIRPQALGLFRKILCELEIASPKVKQIFYKAALVDAFNKEGDNIATLDEHVKVLLKFFDELIGLVDNEEESREMIKKIGAAHSILARSCAFGGEIWERLGEISMERLCTLEPIQKSREATRAWRTLLACIVDELRSGFDEESKLASRRSSSSSDLPDDVNLGGREEDFAVHQSSERVCPFVSEQDDEDDLPNKLHELRMQYTNTVPL